MATGIKTALNLFKVCYHLMVISLWVRSLKYVSKASGPCDVREDIKQGGNGYWIPGG